MAMHHAIVPLPGVSQVRAAGIKSVKSAANDGGIGKDDIKRMEAHIGDLVSDATGVLDSLLAAKVEEVSGK